MDMSRVRTVMIGLGIGLGCATQGIGVGCGASEQPPPSTGSDASTTAGSTTSTGAATVAKTDSTAAGTATTSVPADSSSSGDASTSSGGTGTEAMLDVFGLTKLYPDAPGGPAWDSQHWQTPDLTLPECVVEPDGTRLITDWDPCDPTGWSRRRGSNDLPITAEGELVLQGNQPRLYIYDEQWTNVEFTTYYRRVTDDGTAWGGAVLGIRSGADGHTGTDNCDAHTYYGRVRHDGNVDFTKELSHPSAASRDTAPLWDGQPLPTEQWIGLKLVAYGIDDDTHVRLELWRDMTEGADGGNWEQISTTDDVGGWSPPNRCPYAEDFIPTAPGVVLIRNTGILDGAGLGQARYKWTSVREISPPR
jgi:hypothetical protein